MTCRSSGTRCAPARAALVHSDASTVPSSKFQIGGEVSDFDASEHVDINPKELKRVDRFCQFALVATSKAIAGSGLDIGAGDRYRQGVLIGSGIGGLSEIESQHSRLFDRGPTRVSPFMIPKLMVKRGQRERLGELGIVRAK